MEDEDCDISRQHCTDVASPGDLIILLLEIFLRPKEKNITKKRMKTREIEK